MNLHKKIILITGLTLFIAIAVNMLFSINFFMNEYYKTLESRALAISQTLKSQLDRLLDLDIPLNELAGFEEQCQDIVRKYSDLKNAMVINRDGVVLFHNDPSRQREIIKDNTILNYLKGSSQEPAFIRDKKKGNYDVLTPVYNLEDQRIGIFMLEFSLYTVMQKTRYLVVYSIFITLISLCAAIILLFFFINLWINRPLKRFVSAIQEITGKGLGFKRYVAVQTKDELGTLASSFNAMIDQLQKVTVSRQELVKEVSERKKAEQQLKESKDALEVQNIALKEINKELDDFTYIVSHDLKEPLRSIDAYSKFVVDDYKDKLGQEGKHYLERIRVNTERMKRLIEDLLEISRLKKSGSTIEEVDMEDVVGEVKMRLEYAIKQKGAEVIIKDKLPKIFCDRIRLTEVFFNLISNSLKFNDKQKPVIEIGCNDKGDFYEFYVKDNGIGIEETYFDKIFEIFQRLGKREDAEGTGAGLTIVKKIIQMHKGKIWLESKAPEGTTFYFSIPKDKSVILGKKLIGEILVEKKLVTEENIKEALEEQRGEGEQNGRAA